MKTGYITVLGRADDVLNVAGHRIATADVESALVSHPACGEAGVCGVPDDIKGEAIVAYVVLRAGLHCVRRTGRRPDRARARRARPDRHPGRDPLRRPSSPKPAAARSCAASSKPKKPAKTSATSPSRNSVARLATTTLGGATSRCRSAPDAPAPRSRRVIPPSMRRAVNALRTRTRLPIIVPAAIDVSDVTDHRVYVEIETATARAYTIDVDLAPGCYGVHACGYFSLSAAARGGGVPHRRVEARRRRSAALGPLRLSDRHGDLVGTTAYTLSVNSHGPPPLPLARAIVANLIDDTILNEQIAAAKLFVAADLVGVPSNLISPWSMM
jgi:hypothetical protein